MYIGSEKHKSNARKALQKAKSVNSIKVYCQYCNHVTNKANLKKHERGCYLNPVNLTLCPVCIGPIKNFKTSTTCSYACSNKHFRVGPGNGNWKEDYYRSTCFHYHEKKCVVCDEVNIVTVHHLDENHENNDPSNLIPLCPTHHQYWHSSFKHLVEEIVLNYIEKWKSGRPPGARTRITRLKAECSNPLS